MLSLLALEIYLFLLFQDGEKAGWNRFFYDGFVKDRNDNYGVSILTSMI